MYSIAPWHEALSVHVIKSHASVVGRDPVNSPVNKGSGPTQHRTVEEYVYANALLAGRELAISIEQFAEQLANETSIYFAAGALLTLGLACGLPS